MTSHVLKSLILNLLYVTLWLMLHNPLTSEWRHFCATPKVILFTLESEVILKRSRICFFLFFLVDNFQGCHLTFFETKIEMVWLFFGHFWLWNFSNFKALFCLFLLKECEPLGSFGSGIHDDDFTTSLSFQFLVSERSSFRALSVRLISVHWYSY